MFKRLIQKIRGLKIPQVRSLDDFRDSRAYEIVQRNMMRISDIPGLYEELVRKKGRMAIAHASLVGDCPPRAHAQLLAGAVLNYELSARKQFEIIVSTKNYEMPSGVNLVHEGSVIMRRSTTIESHTHSADECLHAADSLYQEYERMNGRG
ncbi:hypothetical protein HYZ97_00100 [Candidatus Pacearchaeota archaeon]|nr:hypothetical protein [Candidatus Pacearchaeota archaeon]